MIKSIEIIDNNSGSKDKKRARALIEYKDGKRKTIKFGQWRSKGTFFDGATDDKRKAYIARHREMNENWNKLDRAGALSRWVLWEFEDMKSIKKFIKEKFKVANVKVNISKIPVR